jgi:cell division protein FtsL
MRGDNENALYILENIYYIHDTIMRSVLRQPLLTSQRDYYQSQVQISEYKLASTERMAAVIVIITILLLCLAMLVMQKRIAQKNAQIERYAEVADEMSRSLFAKKAEVDDISSRLSTHNARIAEMDKQVAVLFKKQFELLNELSSTFYETHGIKKDKEAIYKHVRENIESFMKNKREIEHLENIVDNYRGGIIGKLREEFPQFGEHDIRFIVFICAGFSPKAISIFMEESVGNIYTKKSRIKSIISRSDSTHKELFIEALS